MKHILYTAFISAILITGACQSISAHNKCDGWKEKMMSEKIAFFTVELNISPEEAQEFWAVYNSIDKERDNARAAVMTAHKAMSEALANGKSEKEISDLLDAYVAAKAKQDEVDINSTEILKTVLSVEKVAKLYVAEEKFRRQYIHKLHNKK